MVSNQVKGLGVLVAALRAEAIVHQGHHWLSNGGDYYGDHLLFDRLYTDANGLVDSVAERTVGTGAGSMVSPKVQADLVQHFINEWCPTEAVTDLDKMQSSLSVVRKVLQHITTIRASLEANDELSDGTDNLLQGVADKHEEFVYLLQQRCSGKVATVNYDRSR